MMTFEAVPAAHGHDDEFFRRGEEVAGRSEMRCVARIRPGELTWTHVRQIDACGEMIFEVATNFFLGSSPLDDRRGERLLDVNDRRVDGSVRPIR